MKKYFPSKFDIPYSMFRGSSGFTLIEIMLVVVIVLIATAIGIPTFRGTFKSTQMTDAVRSTIKVARFARSMSIIEQADCTLQFDKNQIKLTCDQETLATRRLPDDIKITAFENENDKTAEKQTVHYYANGMNDGFTLTLSDNENRTKTLSCHPITGKVEVEE